MSPFTRIVINVELVRELDGRWGTVCEVKNLDTGKEAISSGPYAPTPQEAAEQGVKVALEALDLES